MAKLTFLLVVVVVVIATVEGQCPLASKVTSCSPKCIEDTQCSSIGGKCCSNICNYKSCVLPNQFGGSAQGSDKYNTGKNTGTGTYCGNTKCSAYEKCEMDRSTKRMKCIRS